MPVHIVVRISAIRQATMHELHGNGELVRKINRSSHMACPVPISRRSNSTTKPSPLPSVKPNNHIVILRLHSASADFWRIA